MPIFLLWLFGTAGVVTVAYRAGKTKAQNTPLSK
jgi:hypothetical protein